MADLPHECKKHVGCALFYDQDKCPFCETENDLAFWSEVGGACEACGGDPSTLICGACRGAGHSPSFDKKFPCETCHGTGKPEKCDECGEEVGS